MAITNQSNLTSKITLPDDTEEEVTTQSNISTTENMTESFVKEISADKEYAKPEEEVVETVVLTNNSEYDITDVTFTATIGEGATFKEGSVTIDGAEQADFDPTTGIVLPDSIAANGGSVTITYTLVIDADATVESVETTANVTYSVNEVTDLSEDLDTVTIEVVNNQIEIVKTSNVSAAISGQTITFTNEIKNNGSITNTDLYFTDPIPTGTTFVEGSVKVNDVEQADYNPETGFALDDLAAGESIIVTFDVTVN